MLSRCSDGYVSKQGRFVHLGLTYLCKGTSRSGLNGLADAFPCKADTDQCGTLSREAGQKVLRCSTSNTGFEEYDPRRTSVYYILLFKN